MKNKKIICAVVSLLTMVVAGVALHYNMLQTRDQYGKYSQQQRTPYGKWDHVLLLEDRGQVAWIQGSSSFGEFPPDTRTTKTFGVISQLPEPLDNIRISSSCSCTNAKCDHSSLKPGETAEISFTYNSVGRRGYNNIDLVLVSNKLVIPIKGRCKIEDVPSMVHVAITPRVININEVWMPNLEKQYRSEATFCNEAILKHLAVKGSASFVQPRLEINPLRPLDACILIGLQNPPAGRINERVILSYRFNGDYYETSIPVLGWTRERFSASPSIVSLGRTALQKAEATVHISANDKLHPSEPIVHIQGDWEVKEVTCRGKGEYDVKVGVRKMQKSMYTHGSLMVGGELGDRPLIIPLFATIS